jgi:NAD(P)-dependent dehydrogenase (short-subunit alcohol dehydrogenase family)
MSKSIFITGTSSGLGKASAKYFAEHGSSVAATMRTREKEINTRSITTFFSDAA